MKTNFLNATTVALLTLSLAYTGCKKSDSDSVSPVVTINGDATTYWQKDKPFTDLGASGHDETDGTVSISVSGTVNSAVVGTYVITYTCKDAAGNKGTAARTVYVVNFDGPYSLVQSACTDATANGTGSSTVVASTITAANGMTISNFGLYAANNVTATFIGNQVQVLSQASATGVSGDKIQGTGTITGAGTAASPLKLTFQFKETDGTGTIFNQGTATFTHI